MDAESPYGMTALHMAVKKGNLEVICALIKAGANIHAETFSFADTPLTLAAKYGYALFLLIFVLLFFFYFLQTKPKMAIL